MKNGFFVCLVAAVLAACVGCQVTATRADVRVAVAFPGPAPVPVVATLTVHGPRAVVSLSQYGLLPRR